MWRRRPGIVDGAQGQESRSRRLVLGVPGRSIAALVEGCRGGALRYAAHERLRRAGIKPGDRLYLGGFADGRFALLGRIAVRDVAEPAAASALLMEPVDAFCAIGGRPFTSASADRLVPHATARALRMCSGNGLRFTRTTEYELHPAALVGVLELDEVSGVALDALLAEVEGPVNTPQPPSAGRSSEGPEGAVSRPARVMDASAARRVPVAEALGRRAANALRRAGIESLGDLPPAEFEALNEPTAPLRSPSGLAARGGDHPSITLL